MRGGSRKRGENIFFVHLLCAWNVSPLQALCGRHYSHAREMAAEREGVPPLTCAIPLWQAHKKPREDHSCRGPQNNTNTKLPCQWGRWARTPFLFHVVGEGVLPVSINLFLTYSFVVVMVTDCLRNPLPEASKVSVPGSSVDCTMAVIMPLNTFIFGVWNDSNDVGSPLAPAR